jgi:hypothetical protein
MFSKIVRIHKGLQIMNFSFSLGAKGKIGKPGESKLRYLVQFIF